MTQNEKDLLAYLLGRAGDEFSNHGCNDLPSSIWKNWTIEERQRFLDKY